ncbi:MAG: hypothetical protein M9890_14925 [Thermomicrobiales bacterium]|nr:hypothetical protein [Thermomicrobiales bacterium]
MRQLLCTLCLVAVVGIIALTGDSAQASASTPVHTVAPAAAIAAPSMLDRWAFLSLVISVGALGIALSGASRRLELRPVLGMASEHAQRLVQQTVRAAATSVVSMTATKPTTPSVPAAVPATTDTAALEALMESIGARYLNDLQSIHGVIEQSWATEVAGRDERIQVLMRQIEMLEHERDILAEKVCDLEQSRSDSTATLKAARDDLERRLAKLDQQIAHSETPGPSPVISAQSTPKRRSGGSSRPSRGQRAKGGR